MSDPIASLKGLAVDVKAKLEAEDIKNSQQLLEHVQTPSSTQSLPTR